MNGTLETEVILNTGSIKIVSNGLTEGTDAFLNERRIETPPLEVMRHVKGLRSAILKWSAEISRQETDRQ